MSRSEFKPIHADLDLGEEFVQESCDASELCHISSHWLAFSNPSFSSDTEAEGHPSQV